MFSISMKYRDIDSIRRHAMVVLSGLTFRRAFNLLMCSISYLRRSPFSLGYPAFLKLEPTSICNLKCFGCRSGDPEGLVDLERSYLAPDLYERFLKQLGPYLLEISFYLWGEPLLNKHLPRYIQMAKEMKIGAVVSTNLNVLTPEMCSGLMTSGLDRLIVCIDGMSEETYGKVRIGGSYSTVMGNLEKLVEARRLHNSKKPTIEWQYVLTDDNAHELELARKKADELGVETFTQMADWGKRGEDEAIVQGRKELKKKILNGCRWPWFAVAVQSNGDIYPCCHTANKKNSSVMNLNTIDILSGWNSLPYRQIRETFKKGGSTDIPDTVCSRCPLV